jgi:hypothetical protein
MCFWDAEERGYCKLVRVYPRPENTLLRVATCRDDQRLRFSSNSLRIRLYSSAQLVSWVKL